MEYLKALLRNVTIVLCYLKDLLKYFKQFGNDIFMKIKLCAPLHYNTM
jgi:hypothetical protein